MEISTLSTDESNHSEMTPHCALKSMPSTFIGGLTFYQVDGWA
jgi:hypothetical protein